MKIVVYAELPEDMHGSFMQPQDGFTIPDGEWAKMSEDERLNKAGAVLERSLRWGYKALPDGFDGWPSWNSRHGDANIR